ncbi:uncharacterized protein PGTG_16986 [Puccinia graminis f. sp. tritici CRL 75-36-700-3]|uniref:Uncharacterized protein n=1 Tax=Puccinia graminis f. sp. tritici (strain CRL 75-36-700-3 / race SCCL) TaxID=418459 RepID=E3L457_PUCGT|nr:uncharacterized protein PGTG_16986 [Puccinia graminis f. sp. tritici CRL 75-36-700-3]EFP91332.1 hypothetical protein PGTG_16986 [Puccinia graminis f. sp. tritici CRL 75-36-700-3]
MDELYSRGSKIRTSFETKGILEPHILTGESSSSRELLGIKEIVASLKVKPVLSKEELADKDSSIFKLKQIIEKLQPLDKKISELKNAHLQEDANQMLEKEPKQWQEKIEKAVDHLLVSGINGPHFNYEELEVIKYISL